MLLSHEKTKEELKNFLVDYFINYGNKRKNNFVVSWHEYAAATYTDVSSLQTSQELTDTKIISNSTYVAKNETTTLHIYPLDFDVLILAFRRYPLPSQFNEDLFFLTFCMINKG